MNKITIGLLIAILVVSVVGLALRSQKSLGGTSNLDSLELDGTLIVDGASTLTGAATLSGTVTLGDEVSFDASSCASVSWNPGAVVSSTVATTSLAMPSGYNAGDILSWGFGTSTCSANNASCLNWSVGPTNVASGTEIEVQLSAAGEQSASINPATATLSVCYFDVP